MKELPDIRSIKGVFDAVDYLESKFDSKVIDKAFSEFYERFKNLSFIRTVAEILTEEADQYFDHHNFVIEKFNLKNMHEETMKNNQNESKHPAEPAEPELLDKEDSQDQYPEFASFGGMFDMILCCDEKGCVPCEEVEDKMKLEMSFDAVLERAEKVQDTKERILTDDEAQEFFEMIGEWAKTNDDLESLESLEDEHSEYSEYSEDDIQVEQVHEAMSYLQGLGISVEQIQTLYDEFGRKYPHGSFTCSVLNHKKIRPFAAGGNIFEDSDGIDNETLFIMRWVAGSLMEKVLDVLKFDLNDSNLVQDLTVGNIGTAQRWAKTVTGSDIEDDTEMMCGRYTTRPRIATFPNNHSKNVPITKICEVSSVCSHHLLAYGTLFDDGANVIVSYIPNEYVLGISKLQRLVNWISKRPTIQEDLTTEIWKAISEAAQTKDVFVGIYNAKHTCESLRGSKTHEGAFTTEWYDGAFNDENLRMSIIQTAR